ncbi:hypothetical protein AVEN_212013-1 [Araneus ventricosus]|uniref:Uncharacterized protein n=1 Tax=Araneus ventricosus TaxID=182803 RepID=A0A4Y2WVU8_ARAVE|nr:hypothetical protein AVEN_212013-1 [Araneus ventricosus]
MNFFPDLWRVVTKCCHMTSTVLQCKVCFLLVFASIARQPEVGRVKPLRIAAHRQQELMAVIAFTENVEFEDCVDEDDIDIRGLTIPEDESDVKMPVYSMNENISSPWEANS